MRIVILGLLASTLTLIGCSGSGGSTDTPDRAFEASIAAAQETGLVKVLETGRPREGRAKLEVGWEERRKPPMSAEPVCKV